MADSEIIPHAKHIAMHNSIPGVSTTAEIPTEALPSVNHTLASKAHRTGRGGISSSAARQIHAPISGRDAINSSSASS